MWHVGIDLHRRMLVMAAVKDDGEVIAPRRIECLDTAAILQPFRAVIEACGTRPRRASDLTIPHRVASPQSPTPLHQASPL